MEVGHRNNYDRYLSYAGRAFRTGKLAYQAYNTLKRSRDNGDSNGDMGSNKRRKVAPRQRTHRGVMVGESRNPRFSKQKSRRRTRKPSRKVIVNKKQVKKWNNAARLAQVDTGLHTEYSRITQQILCAANLSNFKDIAVNDSTQLKVFLDSLQFYDNAVLVQRDTLSLGHSVAMYIKTYSKSTWVNNFQVPVWADLYQMEALIPTVSTPVTFYQAGLTDRGLSAGPALSVNSVHAYPSQSSVLTSSYKIKEHKKICLKPGESYSMDRTDRFKWDEEWLNSITLGFQKEFRTHFYCTRVEGVIAHTSTTPFTNVGTSAGGLDQLVDIKAIVEYGAGMRVRPLASTNSSGTISPSGVVSFESNTENRAFSAAL